jgi:uncharacterized membrane protein
VLITVLRVVAWVALICGVLLALLSYLTVDKNHVAIALACWLGIGVFLWLTLLVAADGMSKARKLKEWNRQAKE